MDDAYRRRPMYDPATDTEIEGPNYPAGSLVEAAEVLNFAGRGLRRALGIDRRFLRVPTSVKAMVWAYVAFVLIGFAIYGVN